MIGYINKKRSKREMETVIAPKNTIDLHKELHNHFGFDSFKLNQEQIIENLLEGNDTFVLMPTGGGKSLCYQLPALIKEGVALIISPLIALMKNQVDSIRSHSDDDSIAHYLNSSLNKGQIQQVKSDVLSGKTKMIFIAPETLTKEENLDFLKRSNVSFVAVDEAHCISEWGHDFRPEYRKIKQMINTIDPGIPIMALTATATPKVRADIIKNLDLNEEGTFVSSFNRDNLYYEIRPKTDKEQAKKEIVQFIKKMPSKSGIIYVQSRKSTEEIAKVLQVNGINAGAYHAGLDNKTRNSVQDRFLMEDLDVIVATIAFGMGIDKPDVRFVIHYDIPKSIENYYQETGRAGRDGLEGKCLAFYSYKDILRLEKFLKDKSFAEREMASQLMEEIVAYSETSACRRKFLLQYFGEKFNDDKCNEKCDNCKNPKEKEDVKDEMVIAIKAVEELKENYGVKILVDFISGKATKELKDYRFDQKEMFGKGSHREPIFWHSILRHGILNDVFYKEIEQYGLIKINPKGHDFKNNPFDIQIPINRDYSSNDTDDVVATTQSNGAALDDTLFKLLKDIRKTEALKLGIQPWIIFMDPALQDMATYYPISKEDLEQISGISKGKAIKYGNTFITAIKEYVEQNNIERSQDFVIKQLANKSKSKVSIIQGIDRKLSLEDIAESSKLSLEDLLDEMNVIVNSGTKLDINYYLEDNMDEEIIEEVFDYFNEAESSKVDDAFEVLKAEDINREEIQMVRIKFITDVVN